MTKTFNQGSPHQKRVLIIDSKSLYARRNGRRNKLRSRRIKLRLALPVHQSVCLMWPKLARAQIKPPSSQYKLNTFNKQPINKLRTFNRHNLQAKYFVHQQPTESVRIRL